MPAATAAGAIVREAGPADAAAVAAFLRAAWREAGEGAAGFAGATAEIVAELATPARIAARIGVAGRRVFVAGPGCAVVGFAPTRPVGGALVELSGIVVARRASGQGIGRRLVALAVDAARRDGFARMVVRTERTNARAIAFYRSRGFEPVGQAVERVGTTEVPVVELSLALEPEA